MNTTVQGFKGSTVQGFSVASRQSSLFFVSCCLMVVGCAAPEPAGAPEPVAGDEQAHVLYVTHTAAFRHAVLERSHEVMRELAEASGAFDVVVTEDPALLTADNLAQYDAVVFYTTGELPMDASQQSALLDFVAGGKGFVGIHSATDTFYEWPEYGRLIGGYFDDHPWHQEITIKVDDQNHPATRHLGASFTLNDEIYQVKDWSRSDVHVLLSVDTSSLDLEDERVHRDDGDFALAWTRPYGQGRVFYTALGHEPDVWNDARFGTHVTEGIRWAIGAVDSEPPPNNLTDRERADGWELLFDGTTIDAWRGFKQDGLPVGWSVEDGAVVRTGEGGDIVSREEYGDFDLKVDWRLESGGNSGIFFRVSEDADAVWHTAPEVQLLDDAAHADGRTPVTSAGSNYAINAPTRDAARPIGEWNTLRLVVQGSHVEHWLNGVEVVDYELGTPEWQTLVAASKFAEFPYGESPRGHFALQDHGDRVGFRNIRVRRLD